MNGDLKFGLKKFKNAKLYFTMKPQLNTSTQTLELSNVRLEADKKHLLIQTGTELFQKTIAQKIQEYGKTDLKPLLESNKKIITKSLYKKLDNNAVLSGEVTNLIVTGIYPSSTTLVIHTKAIGQLKLKMSDYSF